MNRMLAFGGAAALLLLLVAGGAAAAPADRLPSPRRQLLRTRTLAQAAGGVPKEQACVWDSTDNTCWPSSWVPLMVDADLKPTDPYVMYHVFALDRWYNCEQQTTKAACSKQQARGCFWKEDPEDPKESYCWSSDRYDDYFLMKNNYVISAVADIPAAMTCPGSKVRWFLGCYAVPAVFAGNDACKAVKGCSPYGAGRNRRCYPDWFIDDMDAKQTGNFADSTLALQAAYVGNCGGACWLRQARVCNTTGTSRSSCERKSYCVYFPESKVCKHYYGALQGDEFSDAELALKRRCWKQDGTSKATCEGQGELPLHQVGKWLNWQMPAETVKCDLEL